MKCIDMKNILRKRYVEVLDQWGIPWEMRPVLKFNKRFKELGCFSWHPKLEIQMSERYFERPFSDTLDTLLHEVAHFMDWRERGYTDHDKNWKGWAKKLGCSGKVRCDKKPPEQKYIVECINIDCDNTWQISRLSRNYKSGRYNCGRCNSKLQISKNKKYKI